jgi:cystathionine gamma-synthase
MTERKELDDATRCAHGGFPSGRGDGGTGGTVPAISPATTFARDEDYSLPHGKMYLRDDHENARHVERLLCALEDGGAARLFSSGLSAAAAVFQSVLVPGDVVVATGVMYFGVRNWLTQFGARFGIEVVLVDGRDTALFARTIAEKRPRIVWLETPGNPMLDVVDVAAVAAAARAVGALCCVDSTAATPVHTKPLTLGAHIVMHSATKYLNGHSDVLAGALVAQRELVEAKDARWAAITQHRHDQGALPGPFEAWLLLRGMRTLHLRVRQQSASALTIAQLLAGRSDVEAVLYPGLPTHTNHHVAVRQMRGGFGGLVSVRVKADPLRVCAGLRVFVRATSLGGTESLVEHRASVEGPGSPTPKDLLRLSIGIEAVDDLVADFTQALDAARA